jgi:hypothetical protein
MSNLKLFISNCKTVVLRKLSKTTLKMSKLIDEKLRKWIVSDENQTDFKKLSAFERGIPKEDPSKSARLRLLKRHVEQNSKKYFWNLCNANEAIGKNLIDLDDWYHVMNNITKYLRETGNFPNWFIQIQNAVWNSFEFVNNDNISEAEFCSLMFIWNVEKEKSSKEYNKVTNSNEHQMNFDLFIDFFRNFILNEIKN